MDDPLLRNVTTYESNGTYWAALQRWVKQACINAGIAIPMSDPLLRDLTTYDSEGTRFAVLQRWLALLANNITGGGGGTITSILAGSGISVTNGTGPAVTIAATLGTTPNNYVTATNSSGDTTITPDKPLYDVGLTISGVARTSNLILATAGRAAGDRIRLAITLPATTGIILTPRNATAGGTLLLPSDIFTTPSQGYTTNGFDISALWEFEYTGTAWRYVTSNIPA